MSGSNVKGTQRPVCGKCNSGYVYVTKKGIVCRRCGAVTPTAKTGPGSGSGE